MLFRDNQDFCQDLSRRSRYLSRNFDIVEAFWVWKWWKVSTDWEILTRKYKNPRTSRLRSRQTVEKRQNFQISTNFSILIETFWSGRWCRNEIEKSRDLLFDAVEIFSTVETHSLTTSRSRETTSRQIETPKASFIAFLFWSLLRGYMSRIPSPYVCTYGEPQTFFICCWW